ncbi:hypothetical protein ACFV4P_14020 [Kitasatospora sp. NPDC059795]|uniref:hypothetical protein n=1 Tax=Kitasatospora sp. NPDC059795 TaxID=3346949 RepID=UPI0036534713
MESARQAGRRGWRSAVLAGLVLVGCTACAYAGGDDVAIEQSALVGDWANMAGARLHIGDDHSATVSDLKHAVPDTTCATEVDDGTWEFWVPVDDDGGYSPSRTATKGKSFVLTLNRDRRGFRCSVDVAVRRDKHGLNLCLVMDPDQGCTEGELLRKIGT